MKKLLFIGVVAVASLASCKKDYTCTCISTTNGVAGTANVTTLVGVSKGAARANCLDATSTDTYAGTTYTTTTDCTLN